MTLHETRLSVVPSRRDTPFRPPPEEPAMTATWADLFERGAAYDFDRETIRAAVDEDSSEGTGNSSEDDDA